MRFNVFARYNAREFIKDNYVYASIYMHVSIPTWSLHIRWIFQLLEILFENLLFVAQSSVSFQHFN